jgi:hypothetical protein
MNKTQQDETELKTQAKSLIRMARFVVEPNSALFVLFHLVYLV